jgi:hypothetical protein
MNASKVAALKALSSSVEASATTTTSADDSTRLRALAEILKHPMA